VTITRHASPHRAFGLAQPWPGWESKPPETFAPHVHAQLFLEDESQAWDTVIEHSAVDLKFLLVEEQARDRQTFGISRRWKAS
jgi:hypothetical protein